MRIVPPYKRMGPKAKPNPFVMDWVRWLYKPPSARVRRLMVAEHKECTYVYRIGGDTPPPYWLRHYETMMDVLIEWHQPRKEV